MKQINIFYIIISFILLVFSGCTDEYEKIEAAGTGILRLGVVTDTPVITKADTPKIQLEIKSRKEGWSRNYDYVANTAIELTAGSYDVVATSGTDNNGKAGFDIPYYRGIASLTITAGKDLTRTINCTLTTAKVSVSFGEDVKELFAGYDYEAVVTGESGTLTFDKSETSSGYFVPGNLSICFQYSTGGEWVKFPMPDILTTSANRHYILKFSLNESGIEGNIGAGSVQLEIEATNDRDANIDIKLPRTTLKANAWAEFAYLKGEIESLGDGSSLYFNWRQKGAEEWIKEPDVIDKNGIYQAVIKDLEPDTEYEYQIAGGNIVEFRTQDIPVIPNMGFEDWIVVEESVSFFGKKKIIYPADNENNIYWSTGNKGVILGGACNTIGVDLEGGNGKYAQLTSTTAIGVFAAGNIFTGEFNLDMGNQIKSANFGKAYWGRPTKLKGKFKYTPKTIDKTKGDYAYLQGSTDMCEIYIRLFTGDMYTADQLPIPGEIAYGTFSTDETVSDWTSFDIPIVYSDLETTPDKIAIVATSSKYGAFFTGGLGSELCIDDFELSFEYHDEIEGE